MKGPIGILALGSFIQGCLRYWPSGDKSAADLSLLPIGEGKVLSISVVIFLTGLRSTCLSHSVAPSGVPLSTSQQRSGGAFRRESPLK